MALSFPFAVIIQLFITGIYTVSTGFAARAEQEVEKGNYRRFRLLANGTLLIIVWTSGWIWLWPGFRGRYWRYKAFWTCCSPGLCRLPIWGYCFT